MALIRNIKCKDCGEYASTFSSRNYCNKCLKIIKEREKQRWIEDFRGSKTLEQRIEQIEEWIHDNRDGLHDHPTF